MCMGGCGKTTLSGGRSSSKSSGKKGTSSRPKTYASSGGTSTYGKPKITFSARNR